MNIVMVLSGDEFIKTEFLDLKINDKFKLIGSQKTNEENEHVYIAKGLPYTKDGLLTIDCSLDILAHNISGVIKID